LRERARRRSSRRLDIGKLAWLTCAVAASVLGARSAAAQSLGEASAIAEGLFQQARELVKQGRYDEACPKLAESQRLDPKLGTLLNLAVCHEKQGRTASAWGEYSSAAGIARREGQREREEFARKQLAALEKQLSHVVLQLSGPVPGLQITLDDQPLTVAVVGVPLPIDPGVHRLAAAAPGRLPWSREVDVPKDRTDMVITVPALDSVPAAAPVPQSAVAPVVVPAPSPPLAPAPQEPPSRRGRPPPSSTPPVLMGVGFGVGGAALLVGAVTGGMSLSNTSSIKSLCSGNACPSGQQGAIDSATTLANVSNVAFALGAAGVAVGIVGVVLRPRTPEQDALVVSPFVGPGVAGLRGRF
jgi:hypothetical protein